MSARFGATPADWFWFSDELGLLADLVPIVCDPNAPWSEHSGVRPAGGKGAVKLPSEFNGSGKARGLVGWTENKTTSREIERWSKDDRIGIGVVCREARIIDIDVEDRETALRIADFVDSFLGVQLPRRTRSNAGKLALLVFVDRAEIVPKESFHVTGGLIEFLGNRQQAVIAGSHTSGARYEWPAGMPERVEITREQWSACIDAVAEEFGTGGRIREVLRDKRPDLEAVDLVAAHIVENGLDLDLSSDGRRLHVACPKIELHGSYNGPSETTWLIAGTNGLPGTFDCRHTTHGKITTAEFLAHIGFEGPAEDVSGDFEPLDPLPEAEPAPAAKISATPYSRRDPRTIPMRPWVYGRQLMRGTVSLLVAPGATGKTALLVGTALALATGRPLLGKEVHDRPQRVWLWNLEDSREELGRLIEAACIQWEIEAEQTAGHLFVDSGVDGSDLCIATADRHGFKVLAPVMDALVTALRASEIDVLIVDPFVSSHRAPENDNGAIDAIAKAWARVAAEAGCSIVLAHHTSKTTGEEVTADKARGASALVNAARSVLALNRMTPVEAMKLGVSESERRRYFRAYDDKNNRAPPAESSDWYRLEGVPLGNGADMFDHGDDIQVVVPWTPPRASDRVGDAELLLVQEKIEAGRWKANAQSPDWAGHAVADALGLDLDSLGVRQRVRALLKGWLTDGSLREEQLRDSSRKLRPHIVVGQRPTMGSLHLNAQDFACSPGEECASEAGCVTCAPVAQ
jgi:hypothetical protein